MESLAWERRILADLLTQAVDGLVVENGIDRASEEEPVDGAELGRQLVRKRLRALEGVSVTVKRRRLLGFRPRRGFQEGHILTVVNDEIGNVSDTNG